MGKNTAKRSPKTKDSPPPVTNQAEPLDDLPGVAGGLGAQAVTARAVTPEATSGERFKPLEFDDAPPAGPDGEPLDRCPRCGSTDGEYRQIRQHGRSGRDPKTGRLYADITWGVVICGECGKRRPRKTFVQVEGPTAEGGDG